MKKTVALILNILIIAICSASIAGYFVLPLWRIEARLSMTDDLAEYINETYISKMETKENEEFDVKQVATDVVENLRKEKFSIGLSVKLNTVDFLTAFAYRDAKAIENVVETAVDSLVTSVSDEISAALQPVTKAAVKTVAKVTISQALKDYDAEEVFVELKIDDEYLDENIEKVYEILSGQDATVETVTSAVMEVFDDVLTKLEESEYADKLADISDEDKEKVRETVEEVLIKIADEDGNINLDELVYKYLDLLGDEDGYDSLKEEFYDKSESSSGLLKTDKSVAYAEEESSKEKTLNEIKLKLKNAIMSSLPSSENQTVLYVIMGIGIWIILSLLVWLYIIIKVLVKMFTDNPCVKLKVAIIFGYSPFIVLQLIPMLAAFMLTKLNLLGSIFSGTVTAISGAVRLTFLTGGVVAFFGSVALFILWFFYRKLRPKKD